MIFAAQLYADDVVDQAAHLIRCRSRSGNIENSAVQVMHILQFRLDGEPLELGAVKYRDGTELLELSAHGPFGFAFHGVIQNGRGDDADFHFAGFNHLQ